MRLGHRLRLDRRSRAQRRAAATGWFDDGLFRSARRQLTAGSLALDIGANVGLWTLPLALGAMDVGTRVVAFEPVPGNQRQLATNIELTGVTDVVMMEPVALSNRTETAELVLREDFVDGAASGNASILIADGADDTYPHIQVATARLDDIVAEHVVAVIKLDVEGHEPEVLEGGQATIRRSRPVIFAEWNTIYHRRRATNATAEVARVLHGLDYRTLRHADGAWQQQARFHSPKPFDHLVLAPAEHAAAIITDLPADGPSSD